jgi:hypothetical protein
VHFYQRPDASHLGVDPNARSLSGYGGLLRVGRSDRDRFRITDRLHWYSPGLELNDLGYLRQADVLANQAFVGWYEPRPKGPLREYSVRATRRDEWDFGGLLTNAVTTLETAAQFRNKWRTEGRLAYHQVVDTRILRGGPALRTHDYTNAYLQASSDSSRRAWASAHAEGSWASGSDDSRAGNLGGEIHARLSNRFSLSSALSYDRLEDNLQYVATPDTEDGPRWVLGRIRQDTWSLTFRANLSITPELSVQYYGSPFIGTGRYTVFKKATDTLAHRYEDRFHAYGASEIAYDPGSNVYRVNEAGGGAGSSYAFDNPDFSFRQFRSNLVARWEFKPGSSLYLVWSQGRTESVPGWESSLAANWDALWARPGDNVFLVKASFWLSP